MDLYHTEVRGKDQRLQLGVPPSFAKMLDMSTGPGPHEPADRDLEDGSPQERVSSREGLSRDLGARNPLDRSVENG